MKIRYSERLKEYMLRKDYHHIEVGTVDARQCCSGFTDIVTDFVTDKGLERIKSKVVRTIPAEVGDIVVTARGLEYDDEIVFDLRTVLGLHDIRVQGIRAWSL